MKSALRIIVGVLGAVCLIANSSHMARGESSMPQYVYGFVALLSIVLIVVGVLEVRPKWLIALLASLILCCVASVLHNKGNLYDFFYLLGVVNFLYLLIPIVVKVNTLLLTKR